MKASGIYIPHSIWEQLRKAIPIRGHSLLVDLVLKSGHRVKSAVADEKGRIVGIANGGREGISDEPLDFESDDIVAARVAEGLLGVLGLTRWKK